MEKVVPPDLFQGILFSKQSMFLHDPTLPPKQMLMIKWRIVLCNYLTFETDNPGDLWWFECSFSYITIVREQSYNQIYQLILATDASDHNYGFNEGDDGLLHHFQQ